MREPPSTVTYVRLESTLWARAVAVQGRAGQVSFWYRQVGLRIGYVTARRLDERTATNRHTTHRKGKGILGSRCGEARQGDEVRW